VRTAAAQVFREYYPLQQSKDVCFEIGRLLMGLKEYVLAVEFFRRSHEACGEHHVTWHNMGICYYYLDNFAAATKAFRQSLTLKPEYKEAQTWLAKVRPCYYPYGSLVCVIVCVSE
jgi:Tfp pilus assembly protein PilF